MLMHGFEDAFVGGLRKVGQKYPIAVYDYAKCIDILMARDGMETEEAVEFIETQCLNAWFGEGTPCMVMACTLEEFKEDAGEEIIEVVEEDKGGPDEDEEEDADRDPGDEDPNASDGPRSKKENEMLGKALMDFAINFMDYVKEVDPAAFARAKEYAMDYSGNDAIKFIDIWKEKGKP